MLFKLLGALTITATLAISLSYNVITHQTIQRLENPDSVQVWVDPPPAVDVDSLRDSWEETWRATLDGVMATARAGSTVIIHEWEPEPPRDRDTTVVIHEWTAPPTEVVLEPPDPWRWRLDARRPGRTM